MQIDQNVFYLCPNSTQRFDLKDDLQYDCEDELEHELEHDFVICSANLSDFVNLEFEFR